MPEIGFHSHTEDPMRTHTQWCRTATPETVSFVSLFYTCGDYSLSFELFCNKITDSYMPLVVFRNPINGGGNMLHGYRGMGELYQSFLNPSDELQLSFFYDCSPFIQSRSVVRHLDQGWGHILLAEDPESIAISLIPREGQRVDFGNNHGLCMSFSRAQTPPPVYRALQKLVEGVDRDNQERPGYGGNHA